MGVVRNRRSATFALAAAFALLATATAPLAPGASASVPARATPPSVAATLTECVTSVVQAERSATFAGEMSAVAGTARMAMRIEIEERLPDEALFHVVAVPGASEWRTSKPKVTVFSYSKQVTDLAAPARYRAWVHFRWLNARGATIRRASRVTRVCGQPAAPAPAPSTPASAP